MANFVKKPPAPREKEGICQTPKELSASGWFYEYRTINSIVQLYIY